LNDHLVVKTGEFSPKTLTIPIIQTQLNDRNEVVGQITQAQNGTGRAERNAEDPGTNLRSNEMQGVGYF
jgi:hypothetical protein